MPNALTPTAARTEDGAGRFEAEDRRVQAALKVWQEIHDTANVDDDPDDLAHAAMSFALVEADRLLPEEIYAAERAANEEREEAVQHMSRLVVAAESRAATAEADMARLKSDNASLVAQVSDLARARGEAEGRLRASEAAGVVEGWRERALAAEAAIETLTRERDEARDGWERWKGLQAGSASVIRQLEGERAALRERGAVLEEALKRIAAHPREYDEGGQSFGVGYAFYSVKKIACAALKGASDAQP